MNDIVEYVCYIGLAVGAAFLLGCEKPQEECPRLDWGTYEMTMVEVAGDCGIPLYSSVISLPAKRNNPHTPSKVVETPECSFYAEYELGQGYEEYVLEMLITPLSKTRAEGEAYFEVWIGETRICAAYLEASYRKIGDL